MNKINYFSLFCIFIVSIFQIGNAALVDPNEIVQANKLMDLMKIAQGPSYDPCYQFGCDSNKGYIINIDLSSFPNWAFSLEDVDFSVFSHLEILKLGKYAFGHSNILTQISGLNSLKTIQTYTLIESANVNLPSTLTTIDFQNFKGVFYAKWVSSKVTTLRVFNVIDFSLSGIFSTNSNLYDIKFPLPPSGFPSLDTIFPSITSMIIYWSETTYNGNIVPASYMGSFSFESLTTLSFQFSENFTTTLTKPIYFPDFSKLTKLHFFSVYGDNFVFNQGQVLDLSQNQKGKLQFIVANSQITYKNCSDCIRLPEDTDCDIAYVNTRIDYIDLRNCNKIQLTNIEPIQEPTFNGFDFNRLVSVDIAGTKLSGALPDELCKVPFSGVNIKSNLFTQPPSCYVCTTDILIRNNIIPNQFPDFTIISPASCPNFKIDQPNNSIYSVETAGDIIYITGHDLGFDVTITGDTINSGFDILNNRIKIFTQPFFGGNREDNKQVDITFFNHQTLTIKYHYAAPSISSYLYIPQNQSIFFIGSGFDYTSTDNQANISNVLYSLPAYLTGAPHLVFDNSEPTIAEGQTFTISVKIGGQTSNVSTFTFKSKNIIVTTENIIVTNNGSTVTVQGEFVKADISKVQLLIGDVSCSIVSLTADSLTFKYPTTKDTGVVNFILIIDGQIYGGTATIQNVLPPFEVPSSSSSSSSSPSDSSKHSSVDDSSVDESESVNSSLKLNFSIGLVLCFLISTLI
ncbi:hypothetical protein DICPUDRAFT_151134 [Dictyostelium purpureum]|uniref:Uncharacterized protein n=1 Tax=Dictyostelium purpureum TaxID=5786 RepID=F0ZI29_DICPU|nr:uncharacterized protein DICPUDRAFT_151134 [Dictyostelium purpureum]EGC36388.1 hypothetical protein DICPUDRAFT_151134 [Dictyostelium purpureum]|eukprot:XP_003287085.1 hypothetical protein DICPUDRAFT_151134 [Dictyostelium purpureum]